MWLHYRALPVISQGKCYLRKFQNYPMGESDTNKIQSNTHWRDCTGTLKSLSVNAVLARGMVSIRNVVIQRFVLAC